MQFWGWRRLALFFVLGFLPNAFGQLTREANTTLRLPPNPPLRGYVLTQVFNRAFSQPVGFATPPGESNRLFIIEKVGRISLITNLTAATPTVLTYLNITNKVASGGERGLLGLAFHPNYASNGFFYIFYTTSGALYDRVARYSVSTGDTNAANPDSEQIIINQQDDADNHNGGDMHFGPDGYLYISTGDEGSSGDALRNSQTITKDFYSAILRIDVDKRPGNLAPNPHPAVTSNYLVPADNPFVGTNRYNGVLIANTNTIRTEFWATGLRNPWRMSFDPLDGTLWVGDVGQNAREEVDIIIKGGNYGWNFREGFIAYQGTPPAGFVGIDPIIDYPRTNNHVSVTGGRVYRGNRYSDLYGAYIYGDYGGGSVWALRTNETGRWVTRTLLNQGGISGFGYDPSNGDILAANVNNGRIYRLGYSAQVTGDPIPLRLSDTGAFSHTPSLAPNPGVVPYEINLPFWSDGAAKKRWFSIPNLNDKMGFDPLQTWLTPTGAVWIKHFELLMTNNNPLSARRLETRFIVRNAGGVYGVTYRWTNSQNAVLVPEEGMDEVLEINDGGVVRQQVWRYPSRSECLGCHTPAAGWVLGFNTPQLNRDATYGAVTEHQLEALERAGYLSNTVGAAHAHLALARPDDNDASQEFRVRSYLAANCAQCHRPNGPAQGLFDTRISTPTDAANLINGPLLDDQGDSSFRVLVPDEPEDSMILRRMSIRGPGQMPPIASNLIDAAGVELVRSFVLGSLRTRQTFAQWQVAKFNEPLPPEAAAEADPDADRASNMLEYLTGSNPTLAGDAWGLRVGLTANGVELRFQNPSNRAVVIETAAEMPGAWTVLDHPANRPVFPATAGERVVQDSVAGSGAKYYRARVMAP